MLYGSSNRCLLAAIVVHYASLNQALQMHLWYILKRVFMLTKVIFLSHLTKTSVKWKHCVFGGRNKALGNSNILWSDLSFLYLLFISPSVSFLWHHRHIFLFDAAVIVCKRRGDNYEMKEVIDLHHFKITNNPTSDKENRKVCSRASLKANQTHIEIATFIDERDNILCWFDG